MKPAKAKQAKKGIRAKSRRKSILLVATAVAVVLAAAAYVYWGGRMFSPPGQRAAGSPATAAMPKADLQRLIGDWVRPDGGYVIEISKNYPDGRVDAEYFNPRSIYVSRSTVSEKDGIIELFLELQGKGYPGSTYTLRYNPAYDLMVGTYFQAVIQQPFEVIFHRK